MIKFWDFQQNSINIVEGVTKIVNKQFQSRDFFNRNRIKEKHMLFYLLKMWKILKLHYIQILFSRIL